MVNAIRAGQPDEADRLMREHISVQSSHITSLIGSLPPNISPNRRSASPSPRSPGQARNPIRRRRSFSNKHEGRPSGGVSANQREGLPPQRGQIDRKRQRTRDETTPSATPTIRDCRKPRQHGP